MRFEWDEHKEQINIRKHSIDFETAKFVFADENLITTQDRDVDGELRWQTIGQVGGMRILLIAHTVRDDRGEEIIRIISARRATRSERRDYDANIMG